MSATRMQESLIVGLFHVLLIALAVLSGTAVARRIRTAAPWVLGAAFAGSGVAAVLTGLARQQPAATVTGFAAGAAVLLVAVVALTRLPYPATVAAAVAGGFIALHAASVTMVLSLYSAEVAPREHSWLWSLAVMGFARDVDQGALAHPGQGWPLWVELSNAIGPLVVLLEITAAFALTYTVRRGRMPAASRRETASVG